jgi:poly(3-hydroxybutyrate) depolymerase
MLYRSYQALADIRDPVRELAFNAERILRTWRSGATLDPFRRMAAYYELVALAGCTHRRPDFGIDSVEFGGVKLPVVEKVVLDTPFASLTRFEKEGTEGEPKVLLVAPMSGHFATLLRGTAKTLAREHDVYITDWKNARDVPAEAGAFHLDDFVATLIDFIHAMGPNSHVLAVCQPTVAALAATAVLAADKDPDQPASLTLMAGPMDARVAPTKVNDLANEKPYEWFEEMMIGTVPERLPGAGRPVYPGFLQLSAFMSMNIERHAKSFVDLFTHRIEGEFEKADAIRAFYEEYFAIMDLPAEFYLDTIKYVFQNPALARGQLHYRDRLVEPSKIRRTFLLTVEGERDDICAVGQTLAAQDFCSGLKPYMKSHHMQPGVGHYGVFNGRKWETQVYPVVRNHIRSSL